MINSVFGKTMENIQNRVDVRLRPSEKSGEKLVPKPNYERTTIFSEVLIAVHMKKTELVFNKPVCGECMITLSLPRSGACNLAILNCAPVFAPRLLRCACGLGM